MRKSSSFITLALCLVLSACGFQLRGTGSFQFALQELQLRAADSRAPLAQSLERRLRAQGVDINHSADYTLYLGHERESRRRISYTAGTRSGEHMLTTSVDYAIRVNSLPDLLTGTAEVQRALSYNQNHVSASDEEARLVRNEMRNDLLMQLMLRLQAITPEQLEALQAEAQAKADAEEQARQQAQEQLEREFNFEPALN